MSASNLRKLLTFAVATATLSLCSNRAFAQSRPATNQSPSTGLPTSAGQVWRAYDIRRYTDRHASDLKPEQTIVDWILRETGTEMWFSGPAGMLTANRTTIRVYHTPAIQKVVGEMIARFVRSETDSSAFGVRMITVSSPNWRTRAVPRMRSVTVQTPGTEAWLCSHEDAALILADLRAQSGFREHNSPNLLVRNGDTHTIERTRPTSYVRGAGPIGLDRALFDEGFKLQVSPLVARDPGDVDVVVRVDSQQIEKFNSLAIPTPTTVNPRQATTVQVPQTSAWRLHERFRWPSEQVLIISCGMVASPGPERRTPRLLTGPRAPRSDALIFIDAKGRTKDMTVASPRQATSGDLQYRGRY